MGSPELLATSSLATTSARSPMRTPVLTPGQRIVSTPGVQVPAQFVYAPPPVIAGADWNRDDVPNALPQAPTSLSVSGRTMSTENLPLGTTSAMASMQVGGMARSAAPLPEAWEAVASPSVLVANA